MQVMPILQCLKKLQNRRSLQLRRNLLEKLQKPKRKSKSLQQKLSRRLRVHLRQRLVAVQKHPRHPQPLPPLQKRTRKKFLLPFQPLLLLQSQKL
ncbi:hypothetical protein J437_LFUL001579 [Ladona fulva]|uniref:Uncharacterized protein n=1 Tax=Ladona fulva TaxID=123851 RepID=A0A8K0P7M7_LADFU|nr:hypothetical protein J437_LFUL001579 [Ladona fulva]